MNDVDRLLNLEQGYSEQLDATLLWFDAAHPGGIDIAGAEAEEEGIRQEILFHLDGNYQDILRVTEAGEDRELTEDNTSGELPFTVERLQNEPCYATLFAEVVEDGQPQWTAARYDLNFESIDYDVWFEDLRGGDHTWVYSDETEYTLSLNAYNLLDRNYKIGWTLGQGDGEGGFVDGKTVPADGIYMVSEDQASITVDGEALAVWMKDNGIENGVEVQAVVLAGTEEERVEVEWEGTWLGLAEPRYEYSFEFEDGEDVYRMPYEDIWVNQEQSYFEESGRYLDGYEEPVTVTGVSVDVIDGAKRAVTSEYSGDENGSGWNLSIRSQCEAEVTITYQREGMEEMELSLIHI